MPHFYMVEGPKTVVPGWYQVRKDTVQETDEPAQSSIKENNNNKHLEIQIIKISRAFIFKFFFFFTCTEKNNTFS